MKTIMTVFLLLVSTSVLAGKPTGCNLNANYHSPVSAGTFGKVMLFPSPAH